MCVFTCLQWSDWVAPYSSTPHQRSCWPLWPQCPPGGWTPFFLTSHWPERKKEKEGPKIDKQTEKRQRGRRKKVRKDKKYSNELHWYSNKDMKCTLWPKYQAFKEYMRCKEVNPWAELTFAPTALPRLMAFLSLCCPPEEGESTELDPRLWLDDAGGRRAEGGPGLDVWGLCCWATEFSNILWSTGRREGRRID